jgi:hypothetical protein
MNFITMLLFVDDEFVHTSVIRNVFEYQLFSLFTMLWFSELKVGTYLCM